MAEQPEPLDLMWGVARIAHAIGRTVRQTETALAKKELPCRKVNGRWVASRTRLRAYFEGGDDVEVH
ncbi:MAG: hypothetical protein Devi2KO_31610 [Devosia indica]